MNQLYRIGLVVFTLTSLALANAPTGSIVLVSHKLKMAASEPVPPRDFYIDLGTNDGVKVGDLFDVYRVITVINMWTGYSPNLLKVPLGELKVYLTGEFTSIGRVSAKVADAEMPVLNYTNFMLGDVVALKSSLPFKQ